MLCSRRCESETLSSVFHHQRWSPLFGERAKRFGNPSTSADISAFVWQCGQIIDSFKIGCEIAIKSRSHLVVYSTPHDLLFVCHLMADSDLGRLLLAVLRPSSNPSMCFTTEAVGIIISNYSFCSLLRRASKMADFLQLSLVA